MCHFIARIALLKRFAAILVFCLLAQAGDRNPFSHKRHAPLKLDCVFCHATAKTGERASYPKSSVCKNCHVEMAPALAKTDRIEPESSVYMLAEFAYFSHARHARAKIACQKCHGDVWTMEEVTQVLPMTMKACVSCHRATHAPTACNKCHELGQ